MTLTLAGTLMRHDGQAARYDEWGLVDAHAYDVDDLIIGEDPLLVTLDHDHDKRVGEVVWLERTEQGDIHCVAVVDDVDELADLDRDLYFSGEILSFPSNRNQLAWIGHGPCLLSVGVCLEPAALGLRPLDIRPGDVRSSASRSGWPLSWKSSSPLLKRASEVSGSRYNRSSLAIHECRRPASITVPTPTWGAASARWSPLQYRSATAADVNRARRIIDVVAVPHDTPTTILEKGRSFVETITRGAFASVTGRTRRVPVNRDHVNERLVGQARNLDPNDPIGLTAELHIARTALGDETLVLAADDVLDCSVCFSIPPGGSVEDRSSRRVHRAELHHIALVPEPAYPTANVIDVRSYA
jgi:HK97 family phage prohead protease